MTNSAEKNTNIPEDSTYQTHVAATPSAVQTDIEGIMSQRDSKESHSLDSDIHVITELVNDRTNYLNDLRLGIVNEGEERVILDRFLDAIGIEKTEETRYIAYERIAQIREDALLAYMSKNNFPEKKQDMILNNARIFLQGFYTDLNSFLISFIQDEELLTPFYRKLITGVNEVGLAFHHFNNAWVDGLIKGVNRRLEARFGDKQNVIEYLTAHNLFDLGHHGEMADRSYSVLAEDGDGYKKLAYIDAFPKEIGDIIDKLKELRNSLNEESDDASGQKQPYINYFDALIAAFSETDTDQLVTRWANVDTVWMSVQSAFQVVHPLEYYEDIYRKAVAPEWDLRLRNNELFTSIVQTNLRKMFETIAGEKGITADSPIGSFSLQGLDKVQLYIMSPLIFFGSQLSGLPSAQVVPNDAEVSKVHGKKIYSFPKNILEKLRTKPDMKLTKIVLSDAIREKRKMLFTGPESQFYALYDIETIGHEFGHTLWLDLDTEVRMNKTGNFKNIEEWKATSGGLMAFFQNPKEELKEEVIIDLVVRSVGLIAWMKQPDVVPYYNEGLIHLKLLFDSGIIFIDSDGKVELTYNEETYEALRRLYVGSYNDLVDAYISKTDATEFLSKYNTEQNGIFLPNDPNLREFVQRYYKLYEEIGSMIDNEE